MIVSALSFAYASGAGNARPKRRGARRVNMQTCRTIPPPLEAAGSSLAFEESKAIEKFWSIEEALPSPFIFFVARTQGGVVSPYPGLLSGHPYGISV